MAVTNNFVGDITIDILLKLPEKSLLRFKRVCKSWRSQIEDPQFIRTHYYLNQILKALKKDRDLSIDDSIIELPPVISHQLSLKFVNSCINGLLLLAAQLCGKIVFWNPEDLNESTSICYPIPNTTPFGLGERIFFAKSLKDPISDTTALEIWSRSKNGSTSCSWKKMLEIEEQGPLFLKKGTGDFLFFRSDKNECAVYDSKSEKLNEVTDGMIEAKRKLKEYKISGPQVSLFIDRAYAEDLISPNV